MHRYIITAIFILGLQLGGFAIREVINVGIFWGTLPSSSLISIELGSYDLIGDGHAVKTMAENQTFLAAVSGGKVQITSGGKIIGSYHKVNLTRKVWGACFNLKGTNPKTDRRTYNDNLVLTVNGNRLKLVNSVYIEHYIAGVVEAESGSKETFEFYKVQAIIARTYVLTNLNKYSKYGFNVCDRVNSQVYKGKSTRNPDIVRAVNATKGLVLVDSDINLIQAVFHSNSGGQTVNSEDAWSKPMGYLRSVPDTFSKDMPHYNWKTFIPEDKWLNYLKKNYKYPVEDSTYREYVLSYCPDVRDVFLSPLDTTIRLKDIRKDWGLRSTFFTIKASDGYVYFEGKGFGHGVGLSQEGAMKMAELGYPYNKILHYYYKDTHLIHLSALDFFRSE
ncbi:MAG: SpoIID/LytB domain-containing protein [Flavobacteriales bacterium]|nr:SpoIID/LytB domain-containing protein [Flavobacteriales bacterium]